jgi:hypothetical protein
MLSYIDQFYIVCLKKPDADSCMEVEYSNVDNQDPEKPNLPAVLSFDKTSMQL